MALSAAQMEKMSRLLDEALPLDVPGRRIWLARLGPDCRDIAPVLREALLATSAGRGTVALATLPKIDAGSGEARAGGEIRRGEQVGPYQLLRELGAGGMAEVWLARRADGAYKRVVALKLPLLARRHKDLERRFATERDILASLEHPNIARLYDAGVTAGGLPYLAMEYVPGQPLTTWCDTRQVGLRERLLLFLQVIEAVQYAHARQIIHRDLKPSNILVGESDQVRLLDFGVAKLLVEDTNDRNQAVQAYARALTPEYASPELLLGESVNAASDVYSLGAVLYEMLSGSRPYDLRCAAPLPLLLQELAHGRIEKPSDRLAPGAGNARATTQDRLAGRLRGDLDAVVLKALARHVADRYASAAALAEDLHRYLRGEPVAAIPPRRSTEELVAHLSRNPKVRVRAHPGAAKAIGAVPAPGTRRPARVLRIATQLVSAADGAQLWARHYDVRLGDGSTEETTIAEAIAESVQAAIRADAPRVDAVGSSSRAQSLLLKAHHFLNRATSADHERALGLLAQAVALDPDHAAAWATLAHAHLTAALAKWAAPAGAIDKAVEAVMRALRIDSNLACAHLVLGLIHEKCHWNRTRAAAEFKRARELDPHDDTASIHQALLGAASSGRLEGAAEVFRHILERNPLNALALDSLGRIQFAAGDGAGAAETYRELVALSPFHRGANASLALALATMAHLPEAIDCAGNEADPLARLSVLPIVLWAANRRPESDAALRELEDRFGVTAPYQLAKNHAYRGAVAPALGWLERALRAREPEFLGARLDPLLQSLRADPRFEALSARINGTA